MSSDAVNDDWRETYKSLITLATEGFKFCALANGGAAVALLAYLGNIAAKGRAAPDMRSAMAAFLVGLVCCGAAMFFAYLTQLHRLNQVSVRARISPDWRLTFAIALVAASLIAFAWGAWLAVVSFK